MIKPNLSSFLRIMNISLVYPETIGQGAYNSQYKTINSCQIRISVPNLLTMVDVKMHKIGRYAVTTARTANTCTDEFTHCYCFNAAAPIFNSLAPSRGRSYGNDSGGVGGAHRIHGGFAGYGLCANGRSGHIIIK